MGLHFGGHTTSNRDLTTTNRGKLRHPSLRHAGDTRQEGFAWRKTPIATGVGGTEKPQAQPAARHVSAPGAAGVEGAGGIQGQAAAPVGGGGAWPGFKTKHNHTSAHQAPPVWRAPEGPEGTGGLRDRPLRAKLACGDLAGGRALRRPEHQRRPENQRSPQRNEAATGFPATASSRSRSAVHNSATSNQAVMST